MDTVFCISVEARGRFLRGIGRALGCVYISLWSYLPQPSNCLISMDGWYNDEGSSSGSIAQQLFEDYRGSFLNVDSNCVPGSAYREGWVYLELEESKLKDLSALQVQRQFYHEAGIKTGVFIGCKNGEIELGFSSSSDANLKTDIVNLFSEEVIHQSLFGELSPSDHSRQSSSSSSLKSLQVSSPDYSSLLLTKPGSSCSPNPRSRVIVPPLPILPYHLAAAAAVAVKQPVISSQHQNLPTPTRDEEAITREMLAIISSSTSNTSPLLLLPQQQPVAQAQRRRVMGAFKPYSTALAPQTFSRQHQHSQHMAKMAILILRRINLNGMEGRLSEESRPTATQLHHMISERRRREKLNESFLALRSLLPPRTKKDKASVLNGTKEYLNALKAQVTELEQRNKKLEVQLLQQHDETESEETDSNESASLWIIREPESTSEMQRITVRITVRVECDVTDLALRVLGCLKTMNYASLESFDARTLSQQQQRQGAATLARLTLTLQFQAGDWDEESMKELLRRAIDGVVAPLQTTNTPTDDDDDHN